MPQSKENRSNRKTSKEEIIPESVDKAVKEETFMAHVMQIMGSNGSYKPTERQIDKILELQEKGMDYTYKERTNFSPALITEIGLILLIVLTFFGLLFFVKQAAPEYLGETITGFIGVLAGGLGGYGYGKVKGQKED